jgi:hypothetical protein
MTEPLLAFALIGATVAIAYGAATFPRKAHLLLATTAPKPEAEAQAIALARAEIAATKRGDDWFSASIDLRAALNEQPCSVIDVEEMPRCKPLDFAKRTI